MDTGKLKKFAQEARTQLMAQVAAKLELVLAEGSAARREAPAAVKELLGEIAHSDKQQVIEKVAYTWFNRFTALRFMDANGLTNPRVVTPAEGQTRPELLADAAAGHMDETIPEPTRNTVAALLDGRTPSRDAQGEAYRLLLVAACNGWHEHMPFMFEKIRDYTELLMPEDLLSQDSILSRMRSVMADEGCQDVEVIGWLYQFYISEKKDQVFAALKKNVKISAENIPAATQLFTPHWIVRYLVENSLGRLWLLNRPQSNLAARMDYYIAPEEPETDFLRVAKPEDIRVCDPACGSGHMLTYAFDLLHAIYEEEGYDAGEIPALILTNNLHGIEIDDRAGALASFALAMKAAAKLGRRRFLRLEAKPNICVLQNVRFTPSEMQDVTVVVGRDLFTAELRETLDQFEQAKNFGSLILPKLRDPAEVARVVRMKDFGSDLLLREVQERVLSVLEMAESLSPKYHVVVANPPYMGRSGANGLLASWAERNYPESRADLYSMFIERCAALSRDSGFFAMITMNGWMFLSTFEKLRKRLMRKHHIVSMAHLGERAFDSIGGAVVSTTAFIFQVKPALSRKGIFLRLVEGRSEAEKRQALLEACRDSGSAIRSRASAEDFSKISSAPIAYWVSPKLFRLFQNGVPIKDFVFSRDGLNTGNNESFIRYFWEVAKSRSFAGAPNAESFWESGCRWAPLIKGGSYRKWFGNLQHVITYDAAGFAVLAMSGNKLPSRENYFRECFSWTRISSPAGSFRYYPQGAVFESASLCVYSENSENLRVILGFSNSVLAPSQLAALSPTVNLLSGYYDMLVVPRLDGQERNVLTVCEDCISLARADWDSYETSWDFAALSILSIDHCDQSLAGSYAHIRAHWQAMTDQMKRLEEENNRIFALASGLEDELIHHVPLEVITLTCNPAYRYGGKASNEELEERLRADTMAEFLHYAVGCMFGRYSIDVPGLILANQGEGLADYLARVPNPRFDVDPDNVIPVLEGEWFADDITERFRKFLRVTFGEEKFQENIAFIEDALGKDIRKWFTKDFFDYHVRRYKKRPIYWMFSSPKGTFNALIYMHRYRPDTVSVVLNDYLRELISKLQAERARLEKLADDASVSQAQRTRAVKEIGTVVKQIDELTAWERDVIFPLAQAKIEIDLDDGVKANYPKFGAALKPIKGLDAKEDE